MSTREILTLQFGHYSNYVGAHWWNIQELDFQYGKHAIKSEINHDVLYREGITQQQQTTYTPRTLIVDIKGTLNAYPEQGDLYAIPTGQAEWDKVDVMACEPARKNEFQAQIDNIACLKSLNLDKEVNTWTDYLYTRFHPRSINIIRQYEHENPSLEFNLFPMGTKLWKNHCFREDFSDKIRRYIEECDSFQGFQVLLDAYNGFSGLSTSCLEYLEEEYENKTIFAIPLLPSYYPDDDTKNDDRQRLDEKRRMINLGLCFDLLNQQSSIFMPLCTSKHGWKRPGPAIEFNHINYNERLWYHSSAILAAALETVSLKYRLASSGYFLRDLVADLTPHGRKTIACSLCLPFSFNQGSNLLECLDNWDGPLTKSITPKCDLGDTRLMQLITLRGISEDLLKDKATAKQRDLPAYRCNTIDELLGMYYGFMCNGSATNVTSYPIGINTSIPFPSIFDERVGYDGHIVADCSDDFEVKRVPVLAGLHSGSEIGHMFADLHTELKKIKFNKFHEFKDDGLDSDDYLECLNNLCTMKECYEDSFLI